MDKLIAKFRHLQTNNRLKNINVTNRIKPINGTVSQPNIGKNSGIIYRMKETKGTGKVLNE